MGISAWIYGLMGFIMAVTLTEKICKKDQEKLKNVWVRRMGVKKNDSRPGLGIGGIFIPVGKSTFLLEKISKF